MGIQYSYDTKEELQKGKKNSTGSKLKYVILVECVEDVAEGKSIALEIE